MWQGIFGAANMLALIAWIVLIVLPRGPTIRSILLYLGVGLLCLVYATGMISILSGLVDPVAIGAGEASFSSIEGVRAIFASDGGVVVGWTHYLAFDLFIGMWIARDADAKSFSRIVQAPILLATFMAGPIGLLIWLIVREARARKLGRPD